MIWIVTLPCCVTLRAGSGDDRPCSSRRLKAVSCRCSSFFSSLLHCCRRLFLTDLLKFSSSQSFRAASYIFIWSAREASTELNFESCKGYGSLAETDNNKRTLFHCAVSKFGLYLCSSRDFEFVKFKRSSNAAVNLRGLLSWLQRIIFWQPARQLLNNM